MEEKELKYVCEKCGEKCETTYLVDHQWICKECNFVVK